MNTVRLKTKAMYFSRVLAPLFHYHKVPLSDCFHRSAHIEIPLKIPPKIALDYEGQKSASRSTRSETTEEIPHKKVYVNKQVDKNLKSFFATAWRAPHPWPGSCGCYIL